MSQRGNLEGCIIIFPGTGPSHDGARTHACIVVKDDSVKGDLYLVPICTFHGGADSTVIVDQKTRGLSLTRKSYIAYYAAKKVPRKATIMRIEGKELTASGLIPKELLDEIIAGVKKSGETEPWFLGAF